MLRCERCGSSYSPLRAVGVEHCPRCQVRDRKDVPLTFKAFELPQKESKRTVERSVA